VVLEVTLVKMSRAADLVSLQEALRLAAPAPAAIAPPPPARAPIPVQAEEPAEPPPSLTGELTLPALVGSWHRVVAEVKKTSPIPGALLEAGKPAKLSGDEIEFSLPATFGKFNVDQLDTPRHRQVIEAALHRVFGRRLGIHATLQRGAPEPDSPMFAKSAAPPDRDLASDPGVRRVLDAFPGSKIVGIE